MKWFKRQHKQAFSPEASAFLRKLTKEAVWLKRLHQEAVSPEFFSLYLLKLTHDTTKDASQTLEKHLNAAEHSKLPKVEEELFYFFVFALEYWWTTDSNHTQEERRIVRQAFEAHLANIHTEEELDTLQERLIAYAQIVNETKGDNAKFTGFGMKLSEFCGMPNALFLVLAPDLFTKALESLTTLKSVRLKLR